MKILKLFQISLIIFINLKADNIIPQDNMLQDLEAKYHLKSNQVLLFDYRKKVPVGILEISPNGKIKKIPLPSKQSFEKDVSKPNSKPKKIDSKEYTKPLPLQQEKLINTNKQWDKKQIPYEIKEEVIQ